MAEYIEREELLERLKFKRKYDRLTGKRCAGLESAIAQVEKAHAADVVEVRHGEWDWYPNRMDRQELLCTNCGEPAPYNEDGERVRTPYCPICGAKMYGKGEG